MTNPNSNATANTLLNGLPHPPVPQGLREMLKDYPGHIERLQQVLNGVVEERPSVIPAFERAIWALEGRLGTFISEARRELEAAEASGDAVAIALAIAKEDLMLDCSTSPASWQTQEMRRYFDNLKWKIVMADNPEKLSDEMHEKIFREKILTRPNFTKATSQEQPRAVILAGQPGAGKGGLADSARTELHGNVVTIDPDRNRDFHPEAERFRRENPYTWSGRTHADAGLWADEGWQAVAAVKKNLIFDTTLSNGEWASETLIKGLQANGYEVEVRAIASPKLESELGVDKRFTDSLSMEGYGRYVPEGARDAIYQKLPASLDTIQANTDVPIRIFNREGSELYDSRTHPRPAGLAMEQERIAPLKKPVFTQRLRAEWGERTDFHRDLPEHARDIPNTDAPTQSRLLNERAALKVPEGVVVRLEGIATVDELIRPGAPPARAPIPEPTIPGLRRAGMTAGLAGIGIAASAYEAHQTGQRVDTLLAQDNPAAAQSELLRYGAVSIGGWAGGTATLAALGSGGGALALAAADAWLLSEAFERGAMLLDNRKIYHQTDRDGVDWKYNGTHWTEQRLGDLQDDGADRPQPQSFFALPEKARELNYLASNEAVAQAMGNVYPRNPHVQPADDSDRAHLFQRDWVHDAATGTWSRSMADEVNRNDQPLWNVEAASPERTASLNQQALQVIDSNIGTGTTDLAARYQRVYHRNGWEDFGPLPQAVQTALDPDNLQAANGKQYHRDEQGQWGHHGERAQGNTTLELDSTRQRLQPVLEQHAQAVAAIPPRQTPTPEQQDRDNIAATYRAYGLTPVAHGPAIQLAVERTRQAHGLEAGNTSLALEPDAFGQYSVNSPIQHLRKDSNGVIQAVAVTRPEEIERARMETRTPASAQEVPRMFTHNDKELAVIVRDRVLRKRRKHDGGMKNFARLLAMSLAFFSLSACGKYKMLEYQYDYNPNPKQRYEITMIINGAPGEFKNIKGVAAYEVSNDACVPLTNPISGVKLNPEQDINFNYSRVSDNEFRGVFYADLLKDEDYFGMGVCKWSLQSVRFSLDAEATVFAPFVMMEKIKDGEEVTTYYTDLEFFETRIPGMLNTGTYDPSDYGDEARKNMFSITLKIKEDF